jgi:hypothetical protein
LTRHTPDKQKQVYNRFSQYTTRTQWEPTTAYY